jgi:glycosyltransferase involved in cell wall biosynthesis
MIWYIVDARLPTEKAHGVQIINMVKELTRLTKTRLVFPKRKNNINESLESYYFCDVSLDKKIVGIVDFFETINWPKVSFFLNKLQFLFAVLCLPYKKGDVVVTRQISIAYLVKLLFKKKIVVACEIHVWPDRKGWLVKPMLNKIDLVVANSEGTAVAAKVNGVKKVETLLNSVNIDYFKKLPEKMVARKQLTIKENAKVVVYVGHLYERKNVMTLLEAAKILPAYNFVIVGGREQELEGLLLKNHQSLPVNLLAVGQVKHEQVGVYMASADVLVLPNSSQNKESLEYTAPLKLFEYMACKRPIVAADLPSSKAILKDMGYYFRADSANDLAETIIRATTKNNEDMITAAYEFSCYNTWAIRAKKLLNMIKEYEHFDSAKK